MTNKKITLHCNIPVDVTKEELEKFLLFKFMGHAIDGYILDKFESEELDVEDFSIF